MHFSVRCNFVAVRVEIRPHEIKGLVLGYSCFEEKKYSCRPVDHAALELLLYFWIYATFILASACKLQIFLFSLWKLGVRTILSSYEASKWAWDPNAMLYPACASDFQDIGWCSPL